MLRHSKHERKGLCPHTLRVPQSDSALLVIPQIFSQSDLSF